ncbi:cysteine and histidine-rich protein 1 isoform X1 [Suncus etruscus]|uniref:cysteine and histidine-rich protein 1 isoform X1 n=1 Tax=Suncus etruscus TaxID=109475 RepID=UPI002110712B|nr:cysteine and histidine-rich protein 1 isoform X1 [Suncus etruscus]
MAPQSYGEWSTALSYLALALVSLYAAVSTAQASRGAAAGFLLQALAAASVLAGGLGTDEDGLAGSWAATVISLPLLAFDFHWVNGDRSSANLLLGGGMVLAVAGGHLGAEARAVAGQAVVLVVAVTILIVAVFTTNTSGIWGGVVLGATGFLSRLDAESLLPLPKDDVCRWTLALGSWAYHRALHAQHLQWE